MILKTESMKKVLFNKKVVRHNMKRIQSNLHKIETYDFSKILLGFLSDEKRYVIDDGINTLAYFRKVKRGQ